MIIMVIVTMIITISATVSKGRLPVRLRGIYLGISVRLRGTNINEHMVTISKGRLPVRLRGAQPAARRRR